MNFGLLLLSSNTEAVAGEAVVNNRFPMLYDIICRHFGLFNTDMGNLLFVAGVILCIVIPYLIGSINPAIIISRKVYHEDIRSYGSGNAGTTNILRTYGTKTAVLIFVLDLVKATVAVLLGSLILSKGIGGAIAALFVVLGHMFPIYYNFKGGKGVACTAMCVLILSPVTFVILLTIFIIIAATTKYISLGSIICAMMFPLLSHVFSPLEGYITLSAFCIGAMVVFMHRENIKRLLAGKESKFSFKQTDKHKAEEHNGAAVVEKPETETHKGVEKEYSDEDFITCSCGRLIPVSREKCAYCGVKNPHFKAKDHPAEGKNKK